MKKKILSLALALCMALSLLPAAALADDNTSTGALQSKINAAESGETITLDEDYTESITIASDDNITLDLNGHTLTNESGKDTITVTLGGELTITGSGTVDNTSHAKAAIYNNGTVTLDGGSYTRSKENGQDKENNGGNSFYVILNHGIMTINGGVKVTQDGHFSSLIENGYQNATSGTARTGYVANTNQQYPTLTINGGEFSGGLNTVKNDDNGILTINGGTFSNTTQAAFLNWNEAVVNGGNFSVATDAGTVILNGSAGANSVDKGKLTITDGTFTASGKIPVIQYMGGSTNMGEIEISGGEFVTGEGTEVIVKSSEDTTARIEVSGGSFSNSVKEYVVDKDYELEHTGTYTYYATLDEALAAAQTGDEITILDAENEEGTTPIKVVTVTFDANGGTCSPTSVNVLQGSADWSLPTPARGGYWYFQGWYNDNGLVNSSYIVTEDVTLIAQWVYIPPVSPNPSYSVNVPAAANGVVSVTPSSATKGSAVTVTVTPDEGYALSSLIVFDSVNQVPVTQVGENKFTFVMPGSAVSVQAVFTRIPDTWTNPFADVAESAWYYDAVKYVAEHGLMNDTGENTFSPDLPTTRGMIMTILARMNGVDTSGGSPWYQKGLDWAVANGVSDGTDPEMNISREQIATMLWRYIGEPASSQSLSAFLDAGQISSWADTAMRWAVEKGLFTGNDRSELNPTNTATRAEVAAILMRFCENIVK